MKSFLGVPIRVRGDVFGNLYLTEKRDGKSFTSIDERKALVLATSAGAVIENARRQVLARNVAVLEDRERIARDLHDSVIQRLYAAGMGLQAVLRRVHDPAVSGRIGEVVDSLDDTIREIRSVIFAVAAARRSGGTVRGDVLRCALDATTALGYEPSVAFDGPVDSLVPDPIAEQALTVVREALANVARHARANAAWVVVSATPSSVTVNVRDDGRGVDGASATTRGGGNGLRNLASRAEALGGELRVRPREGGGTDLSWTVPLPAT
jgi:signal transduction histidine kinase